MKTESLTLLEGRCSSSASACKKFYDQVIDRFTINDNIFVIRGYELLVFLEKQFLSSEECSIFMEQIDANCSPSTVLGPMPNGDYRTSSSASLSAGCQSLASDVSRRIDDLLGIASRFGEPLSGHRYLVGQQFQPHCDWFDTKSDYWQHQYEVGGQRTWTAMIALNQPAAGGDTLFTHAGLRISPRVGNLIVWPNCRADGRENIMSMHAGEPVREGSKYVLTKWYRERPFSPVQEGGGEGKDRHFRQAIH